MVDRRRFIGNDTVSGGSKIKPYRTPGHTIIRQSELLQTQRQHMIAYTTKPPALPLPKSVKKSLPDTLNFNQFAYSVLLIATIATIAIATPLINWAFLVYGVLAVIVRLQSRTIFLSALVCIVLAAVSSAFSRNSLCSTFASMTFYFIFIGLIRAIFELRAHDLVNSKPRLSTQEHSK